MVQYVECYPEYQKLEGFLKCILRILKLSFKPWTLLRGYEKFILVLIYNIYSLISAVFTLVYFEQNIMAILLRIMVIAGFMEVLIKSLVIIMQTNKLKILFLFIEEIHQIHEFDLITDSAKFYMKHLKRSLGLIKIILRILFLGMLMASVAMTFYIFYTDSMALAVPGVFPSKNSSLFYQHVHQCICFQISTIIISMSDTVIIIIGFYFIAVLNIFQDIIQYIEQFDSRNKEGVLIQLYKFHCNILEKFNIFSEVFYYFISVQIAASAIFILCVFFLVLSEVSFIPLFVLVHGQFAVICIFGELMYSKTERFSTEFYLTNWYELGSKEQKILLTMMFMSQKTFGLKAAGMYDINLRMFIEVVKAGVSFLTILYTLA
uniref:Odorant receptor n=1 Tax=Phlebotomus papatasi TaxID=29031 RepID=A0A3F2ZEM1_PHLPP